MRYRRLTTPQPTPEAEIDSPEIIEAAAFVESGDELLAMLAELARYGMELAQAQRDYAMARLAAVTVAGAALNHGEDPTAAFNKISQTVRRTIALQLKLKEDVGKRRAGLTVDRAAKRAEQAADHAGAVKTAIKSALVGAYLTGANMTDFDAEEDPETADFRQLEEQELLHDAEDLLGDLDQYGDWLNRPVGETVVRLCVALGLEPAGCIKQGDKWMVRRPDTLYETLQEERRTSSSLPQSGEGQAAQRPGWGAAGDPSMIDVAATPHPDRFAICPSP